MWVFRKFPKHLFCSLGAVTPVNSYILVIKNLNNLQTIPNEHETIPNEQKTIPNEH